MSVTVTALDSGEATITVTTADGNKPDQCVVTVKPEPLPTELYLYGTATSADANGGQKFRKTDDGVFVIYTKLAAGNISFKNSTGATAKNYYFDVDNKLVRGDGATTVTATDLSGYWIAERITINFNNSTMKREKIGDLHVIWAQTGCNMGPYSTGSRNDALRMTYNGNGVFSRVIDKITVPYQHSAWGAQTTDDDRFNIFLQIDNTVDVNWYHWCSFQDWTADPPADDAPLTDFRIVEVRNAGQWYQNFKISHSKFNAVNATLKIYTNKDDLMYYAFE
jgi:hypothetical protein